MDSQHRALCFLLTSLVFWWVILAPWPSRSAVVAVDGDSVSADGADVLNTVLSAALAFSGKVLYPSYAAAERISRLTPAEGPGGWQEQRCGC